MRGERGKRGEERKWRMREKTEERMRGGEEGVGKRDRKRKVEEGEKGQGGRTERERERKIGRKEK